MSITTETGRVAEEFCAEIRRAMNRGRYAMMTQADLAKRLEISPPALSRLLSGKHNLTISTMVRLAEIFDLRCNIQLW